MLRNLNQPASGRTCGQSWIEIPLAGHALRNLNTLQTPRRIMGTAKIGFLGADILDNGGSTNPLANDSLSRTSRYRMVIGVSTFPTIFCWENGATQITVPGAAVYQLYEDGIRVTSAQDDRTIDVTEEIVVIPPIPPTPPASTFNSGGWAGLIHPTRRKRYEEVEEVAESALEVVVPTEPLKTVEVRPIVPQRVTVDVVPVAKQWLDQWAKQYGLRLPANAYADLLNLGSAAIASVPRKLVDPVIDQASIDEATRQLLESRNKEDEELLLLT